MRCPDSEALISLALDEELSEFDRIQLEEHLHACADCVTHRSVLTRGSELLGAAHVAPPENFEWKVQLGIQKALRDRSSVALPGARPAFWKPFGVAASSVAAAVLIAGALWLPSSSPVPAGTGAAPVAVAEVHLPNPVQLPDGSPYAAYGTGRQVSASSLPSSRVFPRVSAIGGLEDFTVEGYWTMRGELERLSLENERLQQELDAMHIAADADAATGESPR